MPWRLSDVPFEGVTVVDGWRGALREDPVTHGENKNNSTAR
jgi:hypothetical protein